MNDILTSALEVTNTVILSSDSNTNLLFKNAGFRNVEIFKTNLDQALSLVTSDTCDLLILDDMFDGSPTIPIIRQVREGGIGDNIFLPIITLISSNDAAAIKQGIEAGADDVVVKPLSVSIINTRINGLLKRKTKYVVTPDYVGPTRGPKEQTEIIEEQLIDVPNIMRAKSEGHHDVVKQIRADIQSACENINKRRVSLQGNQIIGLINQLVADPGNFDNLIKQTRSVAQDFTSRLKDTDFYHISQLCQMLNKVTAEVTGADDKRNVELLVLLGQAVALSFKDDEASQTQAMEMVALIKSKF